MSADIKHTGTVKRWNPDKGYGFIVVAGQPDVFFHISAVRSSEKLREGATVEFYIVPSARKPGSLAAEYVVVIETAGGQP